MKKKLVGCLLAAGLIGLSSCSQDETNAVNRSESINFHPTLGASTRGAVTTLSNLSPFKVTAFKTSGGANLFENAEVKQTGGKWEMTDPQTWPGNEEVKFFAYAPANLPAGASVYINSGTQKIFSYVTPQKVSDQKDIVVAHNTGSRTTSASGVALNFKHILSQIEVKAKCSDPTVTIKVQGVKVCQVKSAANFTFPTSPTTASGPLAGWDAPNAPASFSARLSAPVTLTASEQNITGTENFMLLPQTLTPWSGAASPNGAYLAVLCQITKNGTQIYPPASGKYGYSAVKIDSAWEAGKKYIYALNFCSPGGGAGNIDPIPTDPVNPTDPTIDPNPGTGGDPVLGNPITFTVTVEDWTAGSTEIGM